jgi:hypothetical protein
MNANILNDVRGATELEARFGYWPTFHDAEVLSLAMERNGLSKLRVQCKDLLVSFILENVTDCDLAEFNHQNVLSSLTLEREKKGYRLILEPCFGLNGNITAERLRIEPEQP